MLSFRQTCILFVRHYRMQPFRQNCPSSKSTLISACRTLRDLRSEFPMLPANSCP
uniref:Uncharacterized protein n=1 Tax=Siphoviridae sp. ctYcY12 TaxID=2825550 RepID=A0A8S5TTZ3_9CAUD|nr:MAG TPA: hypothetical protein [Siphoviridae sp. ctYcY12]